MSRTESKSPQGATGLPASVEQVWGLREVPTKGPKRAQSLDEIVAAAIAIADADGLAAVSMSRVAAELGMATMALYRYVSAKGELIDLMRDAAGGTPSEDLIKARDWRGGLACWAWENRAATLAHPWLIEVPIDGPPLLPNGVAWMDAGLRCLRDTNLIPEERMAMLLLITGYVHSQAVLEIQLGAAIRASGGSEQAFIQDYGKQLARLIEGKDFPALREVVDAGVFDAQEEYPDEDFRFGLERVLDGMGAFIAGKSAAG